MTNQQAIKWFRTEYAKIICDSCETPVGMAISALEKLDLQPTCNNLATDTISRQAVLDAIKTSRFLVDAMEKVIKLPSAQPDAEYISQQAVTESDLIDWYINSVDESEPVWTEEHIYELFNDFYLIPKENR